MSDDRTLLAFGTRVAFNHKGSHLVAYIRTRQLNPRRKPGIGRVSYTVAVEIDGHASGWRLQVKAAELEVL